MCEGGQELGLRQLLASVQEGSVEEVEDLLKKLKEQSLPSVRQQSFTAVLNTSDNTHRTPLSLSCQLKRGDVVNLLLQYGANPNSCVEPNGKTALHYACDHKEWNVGIVRQLLEAGAKPDQQMTDGQTALHIASSHDNVEVISLLLAHYADVNISDSQNRNALCITKSASVAKLLIDAGSDVDSNFGLPVFHAVHNGLCDLTELLIKSGSNLNYDPLMTIACRKGSLCIIKALVKAGLGVKSCPHLALAVELSQCTAEVVEYLISAGCSVNSVIHSDKWRAIHAACNIVSVEKVHLLLAHKALVSGPSFPSLYKAITKKQRRYQFGVLYQSQLSEVVILIKLLHAAGARMYKSDVDELEEDFALVSDPHLKKTLMNLLDSCLHQPQRLDCICRIAVRNNTPANIDKHMQQLPLPLNLKSFLVFGDIVN